MATELLVVGPIFDSKVHILSPCLYLLGSCVRLLGSSCKTKLSASLPTFMVAFHSYLWVGNPELWLFYLSLECCCLPSNSLCWGRDSSYCSFTYWWEFRQVIRFRFVAFMFIPVCTHVTTSKWNWEWRFLTNVSRGSKPVHSKRESRDILSHGSTEFVLARYFCFFFELYRSRSSRLLDPWLLPSASVPFRLPSVFTTVLFLSVPLLSPASLIIVSLIVF